MQIHTGYLAGIFGSLAGTKALNLIPIFDKYRTVRFDIFHASWPWASELGAIAKNFPTCGPICPGPDYEPYRVRAGLSEWLDGGAVQQDLAYGADTGCPGVTSATPSRPSSGSPGCWRRRSRPGLLRRGHGPRGRLWPSCWKTARSFTGFTEPTSAGEADGGRDMLRVTRVLALVLIAALVTTGCALRPYRPLPRETTLAA